MQPFPHPSDATHKILSRLANWFQRCSSLKVWTTDDDGRRRTPTTDGRRTIGILLAHLVSLRLRWAKNLFEVWFYTIFFMILYMYIHVAPGQGLTTPRGQIFYVNRNILSLWSFVASFKKNLFEVWFYAIFFMILYMYIAPGQGQTAPRGQSFNVNRNVLSFHSLDNP